MPNFLIKQGDVYYVRMDVPEDLQAHYGKKVFKRSLRTTEIQEAKARSNYYLAEWRTDFQRVRTQWRVESGETRSIPSKYLNALQPKIDQWKSDLFEASKPLNETIRFSTDSTAVTAAQKALQKLQEDYKTKYGDTPEIPPGEWEREYARAITYKAFNPGKLVAMPDNSTGPISSLIEEIVQGKVVPKNDLFRKQLRDKFASFQKDHVEAKTHDMRLGALNDVAKHFQTNKLHLDKAGVTEYLQIIKSLAINTKRRKLSSGKLYFEFLRAEGLVSENAPNPFIGHTLKEKQKEAAKAIRQPFKRIHIEQLYAEAIRRKDQPLADCILIGAYTGMRIEEVCQLKANSIGDQLFTIQDAKTKAGIREVPIHPAIADHIEALCKASKDGYLIPSSAENKYRRRSESISKRFATIRTAMGFGPEHVYHSIRKTVTTILEHAGITESVAADILGHEKPTMTFGLYSGGSSLEQRKAAIEMLSYKFPLP